MLRTLLQPFYTAYVLISFLICLLLSFPVFFIIALFNSVKARRTMWLVIRYWSIGWLWIIGMPVRIIGKRPAGNKYVIVANHISYLDTVVIFPAIPFYFRALGKYEMSKMPLLGFIYKQVVIMVKRDSAHNRARSMRLMWRVLHKESSIIVFPEGTFNETGAPLKDFYDGAFRLAINAQTPVLPILFPDTVNRWHYNHWWKLWPGRNRAVYLEPISVTGLEPKDLPALKEQVYKAMEAGLVKLGYNTAK
jgi:1-acyl-sn-glycerol-3-phosphate acyltransferase